MFGAYGWTYGQNGPNYRKASLKTLKKSNNPQNRIQKNTKGILSNLNEFYKKLSRI